MKRSVILHSYHIKQWAEDPSVKNIIIGTGAIARDMRDKLRLLGLQAPFLIGGADGCDNEIRHYSHIAELKNPKEYRFIVCCDTDEWELSSRAINAAHRFMGRAAFLHPRVIRYCLDDVLKEQAGANVFDAAACNIILRDDKPYILFEDKGLFGNKDSAFNIHIIGSCHSGGIWRPTKDSFPETLYKSLDKLGFGARLYTWGQPSNLTSDIITRFVRDVCFHNADLVILFNTIDELSSVNTNKKNILPARSINDAHKPEFIKLLNSAYKGEISNGADHNASLFDIRRIQQRIFIALSKLYGFRFWDIIPPGVKLLPEALAQRYGGLSKGYYARQRARKEDLLAVLNREHTKDYTKTFNGVNDIYEMFTDGMHFSDKGNELLAKRCARDIIETFGGCENGKNA